MPLFLSGHQVGDRDPDWIQVKTPHSLQNECIYKDKASLSAFHRRRSSLGKQMWVGRSSKYFLIKITMKLGVLVTPAKAHNGLIMPQGSTGTNGTSEGKRAEADYRASHESLWGTTHLLNHEKARHGWGPLGSHPSTLLSLCSVTSKKENQCS